MKLPESILSRLRGPLVAAALAGCSAPPASEPAAPSIEPVAEPAAAPEAPDPVAYDAERERERLARLDREQAADEHRRAQRLEERQRTEVQSVFGGLIGLSRARWDPHPACGRG